VTFEASPEAAFTSTLAISKGGARAVAMAVRGRATKDFKRRVEIAPHGPIGLPWLYNVLSSDISL
jgi:hypothetical protein